MQGADSAASTTAAQADESVAVASAPLVIQGIGVGRGVAIGRAEVLASSRAAVEHYFIEPEAVEAEINRVLQARDAGANLRHRRHRRGGQRRGPALARAHRLDPAAALDRGRRGLSATPR